MPSFEAKKKYKVKSRGIKKSRSGVKKAMPAALKKYQAFMIAFKRPGKKAEVLRWWASRRR